MPWSRFQIGSMCLVGTLYTTPHLPLDLLSNTLPCVSGQTSWVQSSSSLIHNLHTMCPSHLLLDDLAGGFTRRKSLLRFPVVTSALPMWPMSWMCLAPVAHAKCMSSCTQSLSRRLSQAVTSQDSLSFFLARWRTLSGACRFPNP